jgi:hypothetical protein
LAGDAKLGFVEEVDMVTANDMPTSMVKSGGLRINGSFLEHEKLLIRLDDREEAEYLKVLVSVRSSKSPVLVRASGIHHV